MKRFFSGVLFSLALVACGGSSNVAGTYTVDIDAMTKMAVDEAKGAITAEAAKKMVESMKLELEVKGDNTYVVSMTMPMGMGTQKSEGTWKMEGSDVAFTEVSENGKKKDKPETKKASYKSGTLTMEEKGQKITLKKK